MDMDNSSVVTVSVQALVPVRGNVSVAKVKPQGGRSQNARAVEFGQPLFVIG